MWKVKRYQNKNKNLKKFKFNFYFRVSETRQTTTQHCHPIFQSNNVPSLTFKPSIAAASTEKVRKFGSDRSLSLSLALSHFPPLSEHTCLYYQSLALPSPPWKWTRNTFTRFSIPPFSLPLSPSLSLPLPLSLFLACTSKFLWRTFEDATAVTPSTWLSHSSE